MYYENEKMDDKNVKGTIDLEGLTHAGMTSLKGEIQLIISNDTLMLHADTNEDAQKWVDVPKTQCPGNNISIVKTMLKFILFHL